MDLPVRLIAKYFGDYVKVPAVSLIQSRPIYINGDTPAANIPV